MIYLIGGVFCGVLLLVVGAINGDLAAILAGAALGAAFTGALLLLRKRYGSLREIPF